MPVPGTPVCGDVYIAFAPPGSKEWCRIQGDILEAVKNIGLAIFDWADGSLQSIQEWGERLESIQVPECGLTTIVSCLVDWVKIAVGWISDKVAYGIRYALCLLRNGVVRSDVCDPVTYSSLMGIKILWYYVKNAEVGSEVWVGVVSKLDRMQIGAIDQLIDYLMNVVCPMEAPRIPEAIEAYLMGKIDKGTFDCWLRLNGMLPDTYQPVLDSRREQLTTDEHIDWIRRQDVPAWGQWHGVSILSTDEQQRETNWFQSGTKAMRQRGWLYSEDADPRYALYDELPSIADHLHWLARNIDDYEYVRDYHLLDGFDNPGLITSIMSAEGVAYEPIPWKRNFWLEFGAELRAQGMRKVDAMRHYAAHWLHASPGQMREFAYRLRPGRKADPWEASVQDYFAQLGYSPDLIARATTFTPDDFRRLLTEQDYAPLDVAWFLSTLYHVPALSYLRDMYRYGTIDESDLKDYHQKLGYTELDSERFVDVDAKLKGRIRTAESFGWTPSALSRSYAYGLIDDAFVDEHMKSQGFNDSETKGMKERAKSQLQARYLSRALGRVISRTITEVSAAYSAGVLDFQAASDAMTALHVPAQTAKGILDMEALRVRVRLSKELQRVVRSAYLKGKVDKAGALNLLTTAGITRNMIEAEMQMWDLELLKTERSATIAEIRRFVLAGLMTPAEARVRLTNLGVDDADAALLVEEIIQKVDALEIKARTAEERQAARRQKELDDAAKAAERTKQRALRELMRQEPVAKLQKWLGMGIIDRAYFNGRLTTYGYPADDIERLAEEACRRRGAECPAAP